MTATLPCCLLGALSSLVMSASLQAQRLEPPPQLHDGLEVRSPSAAGLRESPLSALSAELVGDRFPNTTSVLVLKDGRLVFERYFGSGGREVLNDTRSAMKSITCARRRPRTGRPRPGFHRRAGLPAADRPHPLQE
jgi:hypothetical protein